MLAVSVDQNYRKYFCKQQVRERYNMKFVKFFVAAAVALSVPAAAYVHVSDRRDSVVAGGSFPPSATNDGRYWG